MSRNQEDKSASYPREQSSIRDMIAAEVSAQMRQVRIELARELKSLRQEMLDSNKTVKIEVQREIEDNSKKQLIISGEKQLALTKQATREITQAVSKSVLTRVFKELDEKVLPEINKMAEWVNYNLEDGAQVVDSYRRAVHDQYTDLDRKLITQGDDRQRGIITEHVSTFFNDND